MDSLVVFIASGLTFLARQGDSLIISKWITAEQLGVFSIAVTFAKLVERFNAQLREVKLVLCAQCAPILLVFAKFGRDIVTLLYDPR